jgi:uncharacterized membrane protein YfcA
VTFDTLAPLALLSFAAAAVQSVTGFGFAVIVAPFYVALLGTSAGIQAVIAVTAVISFVVVPRIRAAIRPRLLVRLAAGSLLGLPLGLYAFRFLPPHLVRAAIGLLILGFCALLLLARPPRPTVSREAVRDAVPDAGEATRVELDLAAGFVSGVTTALMGMSGPPILIYLMLARIDKEAIRATLLAFFALSYLASLAVHAATVGIALSTWIVAAAMLPVAAAGALLGDLIAGRLSQRAFERAVLAILAGAGIYTIVAALI